MSGIIWQNRQKFDFSRRFLRFLMSTDKRVQISKLLNIYEGQMVLLKFSKGKLTNDIKLH